MEDFLGVTQLKTELNQKCPNGEQLNALYGSGNVKSQVYNNIPGLGGRRSDFMVNTPNGSFLVEVKSGNASYKGLQVQKDAKILRL
jgi:DNA-binding sugar fermentation-stimulating protein